MASCNRSFPKVEETIEIESKEQVEKREENLNMIRVGKPAPNFTAPAYHKGEFKEVSLEDYKGQWVMLCFYPGDFTFV